MSDTNQINSAPPSSDNGSTGAFSKIYDVFSDKNVIIIILLVLVILSMIGINLLQITGTIVSEVTDPIAPAVRSILSMIGFTTGNLIKGSADLVANTADVGIDIAKGTTHSIGDLLINSSKPGIDYSQQVSLSEVIGIPKLHYISNATPQPVQSSEPTVTPIGTQKPKAGWCYVADFSGVRGCVEVTEHDKCMSGQIFPSKAECLKPGSS